MRKLRMKVRTCAMKEQKIIDELEDHTFSDDNNKRYNMYASTHECAQV